jgi:SAM-dependent MidA family methyltransferase
MMADMLRVVASLAPELYEAMTVHLVETSERLTERQRQTLHRHAGKIAWHARHEDVPSGFTLLAANEFFDAIPMRQFVKTADGFRERLVGRGDDGELAFVGGAATLDGPLPAGADRCPDGTVLEVSPARDAIMAAIAGRLRDAGGVALVIDYGHVVSGFGDTLQALRDHAYDPPLAHPGEADLTSHVAFEDLARAASQAGAHVAGAIGQGDFLVGLGLLERAGALGAGKDDSTQQSIREAVERLAGAGPGKMGELFKVMAVAGERVAPAPFKAAD